MVEQVWTVEELLAAEPADTFALLFRRSHRPDRLIGLASRGVVVRLRERHMTGRIAATHGSPYLYDRHVPIVLMGAGIEPGRDEERVSTVDMAPTLAFLAGAPYPEDLDGRPLITGDRSR